MGNGVVGRALMPDWQTLVNLEMSGINARPTPFSFLRLND